MTDSLKGKTALVTGGTFGIGRDTALGLARLGARVIIVGCDAARTQAAQTWLLERARGAQIDTELADLSSVWQVHALAERLRTRYERLDVLINNAGALYPKFLRSEDGLELTWALNHLGAFALTLGLKPLLLAAVRAPAQTAADYSPQAMNGNEIPQAGDGIPQAGDGMPQAGDIPAQSPAGNGARVVNVTSKLHKRAGNVFYDPQWLDSNGRGYRGSVAYARSKLANILFTYALARRWQAEGIRVNCVSPGIVGTGLNRHMPLPVRLLAPIFNRIALTPEQGAQTSVYAACAPQLHNVSGTYLYRKEPIQSSPASHDTTLQEQLWALSLEQTGLRER